jgi:adenine-specific DNA-methyltransferase
MTHLSLFGDQVFDAPNTEGIKYAGSKLKLLPHILQLVRKTEAKTVFDGFAGTTRVSQALARSGYKVFSSDVSAWSKVFATCYLLNSRPRDYYTPIIEHLNSLQGIDGWFTKHYGGDQNEGSSIGADGLKKPWQRHNTRKLDAIRDEIDRLDLPEEEHSVLLASLILALDSVDSTLGHFASYLNEWSARSYNPLRLKVPDLLNYSPGHKVYSGDIFGVLPQVESDVAYFDPPYGSNNEKMPPSRVRYSAYYHVWTTVCLNDKPELFGKVKRRSDTSDVISASVFEEFRKDSDGRFIAVKAIHRLLKEANANYIILSYSSGGRATAGELNDCISDIGRTREVLEIDYKKNVMAGMQWTKEWIKEAEEPNREFLFLIEKEKQPNNAIHRMATRVMPPADSASLRLGRSHATGSHR